MKRRKSREAAFSIIFEYDFNREADPNQLIEDAINELDMTFDEYAVQMINGTVKNIEAIDKLITDSLQNWKFERISKTSKAMMRIALYEILYEKLAPAVAIDEMLEIAKEYESNETANFINGVLGNAIKQIDNGKV